MASRTINKLAIKTFEANLIHLSQQRYAKAMPIVQVKQKGTSADHFPRMAARDLMVAKTSQAVDTPTDFSTFSNRVTTPATYHDAERHEPEDAAVILPDPNAATLHAMAMEVARKQDSIIFAAAIGNALDEAGNTIALPNGQIVANAALSIGYIRNVMEIFLSNNIDPSEEKFAFISPNVYKQLLAITEVASADYNDQRPLPSGVVSRFMGFNWIPHTGLNLHDTNQRDCLFLTRRAMGYLSVKPPWVRVAEDPTKSFSTVIYTAFTAGAVRVEDEHIVKGIVTES